MKKITINEDDVNRLIAISDIHGHDKIFSKLYEKLDLQASDHLVILGDFLNKGTNSYKTYRKIKELSQSKNCHVLKGNHEYFIQHYLINGDSDNEFLDFLKKEHYETIIHSILDSEGLRAEDFKTGNGLLSEVKRIEPDLISFLEDLPIILETEGFRLVHGGYDETFNIEEDEVRFLKFDYFNQLSKKQEKTTIVGHWPCCLLRSRMLSNVPFINPKKNIISIDGGLGVKATGELNAFIIMFIEDSYQYHLEQCNNFDLMQVIEKHSFNEEEPRFISYPNLEIELIKSGETISQYKHIMSGDIVSIPNTLVDVVDKKHQLKINYVNRFFNLEPGTTVEFCKKYKEMALVKYNQEFGWLYYKGLK